jgi:hypothetical protein
MHFEFAIAFASGVLSGSIALAAIVILARIPTANIGCV